jgi:hypothetical protein
MDDVNLKDVGLRHTETLTLTAGDMRLLHKPLAVESLTSGDGFGEQFVLGQDFQLTPEGNLRWTGAAERLGQRALLVYRRQP